MTDFSDLLARSVFALRPGLADSAVDRGDGGAGSSEGGSAAPSDATAAVPATVVPPAAAVASEPHASEPCPSDQHDDRGYRAVVFDKPHTGTVDAQGMVEPRHRVTVSCCLCPGVFHLSASGYGEMARRVEAAGWRYTPGRHLHDRAWCPACRPNAGKAVA
ncbi:hypothetical protein [Glycomyces arizonensis]|uniref:hypothetical protein n=1 Tax=Glycomyces arizonensis TaxID=256035 RepID=UPI00047A9240|nr:hypothetical protein [Glycomyces arizonensis]